MFVPQWDGQVCSLGYDVADWIEAYCCHGPGDVQGQPVVLDAEWLAFLVAAYELDPKTGRRKIDRAVMSRPKGRAKSELAGFVTVVEALGPARFDGWNAEGQPVGRPVVSPLIKCLATEETQAGNTFENAAFIVCDYGRDVHPEIFGGASGVRQYQSATSIYLPNGGEMASCTSGAASKDGGKETFVVPDETHLYVTNELRSMYATVARNCGKRKIAEPWMLQTTTAYKRGQNSVAETILNAWADGKLPNQAHWLVDHREALGPVNIKDKAHTMRQLRHVYGAASAWMDLERIYRTMLDPTECETPEVAARYFLNLPSEGDVRESALDLNRWKASADPSAEQPPQVSWAVATDAGETWAANGAAWRRPDGRVQVSLVDYRAGSGWVRARCAELGVRRPLVDKASRGLVDDGEELTQADQALAHNGFARALLDDGIRHDDLPALNVAVRASRWRPLGDTRVFDRKCETEISPLLAVALAAHGASQSVDLALGVW
ncbi:MAG: hypothetical protein ACXV5Q_01320 [Frankiaceae bacterium]